MNSLQYLWFLFKKYGNSECVVFAPLVLITERLEFD